MFVHFAKSEDRLCYVINKLNTCQMHRRMFVSVCEDLKTVPKMSYVITYVIIQPCPQFSIMSCYQLSEDLFQPNIIHS